MIRRIAIVYIILHVVCSLDAQLNWEFKFGPSYTNVKHVQSGQQITYNHSKNAPLWNLGFQFGANRFVYVSNKIRLQSGLMIQLKGDRNSRHEIFPDNEYHGIRFFYLAAPLHVDIKLLSNYKMYLFGGVSGEFLFHQNKVNQGLPYFPIENIWDRLGLSAQLGYKYEFSDYFSLSLNYSQGLTNIYITESIFDDGNDINYIHQGFELSTFLKL